MLETQWNDRTIKVKGNWTGRWLFLAPDYELWIDDQKIDRAGGPRLSPKLEGIVEDEDGKMHHIVADVVSVVGWRPSCEVSIEGDVIANDRVIVENFINPFLVVFILISTAVMLYVGPDVLRSLVK